MDRSSRRTLPLLLAALAALLLVWSPAVAPVIEPTRDMTPDVAPEAVPNVVPHAAPDVVPDAVSDAVPGGASGAGWQEPVVDRSCKPSGPLDVSLVAADGGVGPIVELAFGIRPVRELRDVRWALELPDDASWLSGALAGDAAGARDALTEGRVRIGLPADGRFRRARLTVQATFDTIDEWGVTTPEPFAVSRTLSWGRPEPVGPVVLTRDGSSGELAPVVSLSTSHRPGR